MLDYRPTPLKVNKVVIRHKITQEINLPLTALEMLQQRCAQIKKADKKKMSLAEKVDYQKELYSITYQLNKEKKLITIPMAVMIFAIILLMMFL